MAQRDALTHIYNKAATNALVAHRMEDFDFTVLQARNGVNVYDSHRQENEILAEANPK